MISTLRNMCSLFASENGFNDFNPVSELAGGSGTQLEWKPV